MNVWALTGSHAGLFIPSGGPKAQPQQHPMLVCEGPTDTAAALALGFDAVGRPSCTGAAEMLSDYIGQQRRRDVVIIADADGPPGGRPACLQDDPGRFGAHALADTLGPVARTVRVITAAPHKDLRAWLGAGATSAAVRARIDNARYHRRST